uniref:hypothetical protein n=1 Tax=Acetatifactor sp. TaxID=1872090 RepID=UPI0040569414
MYKEVHTINNIRRSYNKLLVISLLGIFMGIYCAMLTFINPTPKYDNLFLDNVVVDTFGYQSKYRGGGDYYIDTADGNRYILNGNFSEIELYDHLLSDTEISIKWYRHRNGMNYVKEIKLGEHILSSYDNDDPIRAVIGCVMGSIVILLGVGGLVFRHRSIKKELAALQK